MTPVLSKEEVEIFHRDGILVPQYQLPATDLGALQELTIRLSRDNPGLLQRPLVSPHVSQQGVRTSADAWMQYATRPAILDLVEQLIGYDLILWGAVLFYKEAGVSPLTEFHQDGRAFPIEPLQAVLMWIAVFDSTVANGCLRCIAGSHQPRRFYRMRATPNRASYGELCPILETEFDRALCRDVELKAGQMMIFDPYLIHGARPNTGQQRRAGYALRYMPSTSYYNRMRKNADQRFDDPGIRNRPLFLVRGTDRCGRNDFRAAGA